MILLVCLLIAGTAYADRATLQNGDGEEIGISGSPIYATVNGSISSAEITGDFTTGANIYNGLGAGEFWNIAGTDTTGVADTPLIFINDDRTGANANHQDEATIRIDAEGSYALYVEDGLAYFDNNVDIGTSNEVQFGSGDFLRFGSTDNGAGDSCGYARHRYHAVGYTSAYFVTSASTPTACTDFDGCVAPTYVFINDSGADSGDYAGVALGERTQADVTATHYFDFYAMTGALDGAVDGTATEIPADFRFGSASFPSALIIDTGDGSVGNNADSDTVGGVTASRAKMGMPTGCAGDYAYFGHVDMFGDGVSYAVAQGASGDTYVNAKSGQALQMMLGNSVVGRFDSTNAFQLTKNSDTLTFTGDGTSWYQKWSDGELILQSSESADAYTIVNIKGNNSHGGYLYLTDGNGPQGQCYVEGSQWVFQGSGLSEFVFNESSADVDLRVESDTKTKALFIEGSGSEEGVHAGDVMNRMRAVQMAGETLSDQTDPRLLLNFYGTAGNGTTEYDLSGNNNDATYTAGSSWTSADNVFKGQVMALDFDGTDDYLTVADSATLSFGDGSNDEAVTLSGWVEIVASASSQRILTKWNGSGTVREYIYGIDGDEKLSYVVYDESADKIASRLTDAPLAVGWHHIAITYDGTGGAVAMNGVTMYVDGLLVASTATNDASYVAMEDTASVVIVGSDYGGNNWDGDMAQITITGEELSASDVWQEFLKGAGKVNEQDNIS